MEAPIKDQVIVIAGPTASGKSALAMDVASEFNGVIINADSMQIYDGLRIVTARPSVEEEAKLSHRLYGVMAPSETCSAGLWEDMAIVEIKKAWAEGKLPILTGGTGLYIKALIEGLSDLPDIDPEIRNTVRKDCDEKGVAHSYSLLQSLDPMMANKLNPTDRQRICRALEVFRTTGKSLLYWQQENKPKPKLATRSETHILIPEREVLYDRCNRRFVHMLEQGAIEEVQKFSKFNLDPNLPAMKALGVSELLDYISGKMSLEETTELAQMQTRRFAKRQCTWFKNQISEAKIHSAQYSESLRDKIYKKIRQFLLTN